MDTIQELFKIDFLYVLISVITILMSAKFTVSIFEWFFNKLGLETKWMRLKREEHELLISTSKNLTELQKKHIEDAKLSEEKDEEIRKDVQKLTNMFLDEKIDDLRWKILDSCSALSNGRKYNREMFDHIIHMYDKYEKILDENDMENGLIDESMKFVREKYRKYLESGNTEFSQEFLPNNDFNNH